MSVLEHDLILAPFTILTTTVSPRRKHSPFGQNSDLDICQELDFSNNTIATIVFTFTTASFANLESSDDYWVT